MDHAKPRVLFVSTVFEEIATGPATFARYLWDAFRDDPHFEFHMLVPFSSVSHPNIHQYGQPKIGFQHHRLLRKELAKLVADPGRFDLVHSNNAHSVAGVDCIAPLVVQLNDYEVANALKNWRGNLARKGARRTVSLFWRYTQERRAVLQSTLAIANSNFVREQISREYRIPLSRSVTIHKAVDPSVFKRPSSLPRDPWPRQNIGSRLIFVGSNWEIKGLDYALAALQQLLVRLPELQLVVIGEQEAGSNSTIRGQYQAIEQRGAVVYLGRKSASEIAQWLWHADIALLTSREEAFGVSVLEAMAAGVPVIGSNAGGIGEILGSGRFGLQCEPADNNALVAAILRLCKSAILRQEYAELGAGRVEQFSIDAMLGRIKQVYLELLSKK